MILNKIPNTWYNFPNYFIEAVANGAHEDECKHLLDYRTLQDIKPRYKEITDFRKYIEYLIFEECLQRWQCMFDWSNMEESEWWFDGYSQIKHSFTSEYDYQGFEDEHYLVVMVANIDGGLGVLVNKHNYEITIFDISEDDGHWFVGGYVYQEKYFNYIKMFLMSQISELHSKNLDHQLIIEKLWNSKSSDVQNNYRW